MSDFSSLDASTRSLLSLSIAAADATPLIVDGDSAIGTQANLRKHRRLSSAGQMRRRLSDARDAAIRPSPVASAPVPIPTAEDDDGDRTKGGKKRATFICESCSKVYRHPSCLIKHRWEHTPYWREASKFLLSKHQQVQLMEAAAILSHLGPGQSLPDDRSLWPSFLSGGSLPSPAAPIATSVPGPRLHDFSVTGGITRLRPGVVGVPTGSSLPDSQGWSPSGSYSSAPVVIKQSTPHSYGVGGWSLPDSSRSSRSRSPSDESDDGDLDLEMQMGGLKMGEGYSFSGRGRANGLIIKDEFDETEEKEDEAWDGMEMEMEM
ncbi:hypothetical protein FA95DRAFT_1604478 [Auriscalpium vulgare]|uniref:Uncharacterized protein n=1 Tax=Auriscalpium vulgare TaxID=40419 RepID=A0ACB8RZT4_9AGAM|nr:hypothetical protein FA95DRAFT_1604478 [Auriscalpium vulgare]